MNKTDKILINSKKIAASLFKGEEINTKDIEVFFDKNDTGELINKLSNPKSRTSYENKLKIINASKKNDWEKLKLKIQPEARVKYIYVISKVAAVFVLFFCLTYFLKNKTTSSSVVNNPEVIIDEDAITLTLDNGNVEVIAPNGARKILNSLGEIVGDQKGAELDYSKKTLKNNDSEVLAYNELNIPYGKRLRLVLSDGTVVFLNAGSSLKYPVKFIKGINRNVFLKGEAYFDVAKDKKHPFVVNANNLDVRVLGTKFNVSSYPEDKFINTVLVEGAVSLYDNDKNYNPEHAQLLTPGNKATWSKHEKNIDIEKVNTSIYTGWIDGKIVFEHIPFKSILKKLERHYGVTITNNNEKLAEETFTATFDIETIEQVLSTFNKSYAINYSIDKDKILIK